MKTDYVWFYGQLWTWEDFCKVAPMELVCSEIPVPTQAQCYDPSGYNE